MATTRKLMIRALLLGASGLTLTVANAVPAAAQNATASISGQVSDGQGAPVPNAVVTARHEGTNQTVNATAGADGRYMLSGLRPAPYTITTNIGGTTVSDRVSVEIGQSATLDLAPAAAPPAGETATTGGDAIVVVGRRLVETRTSEVATNVSQEQIRSLPQSDRNFLSFAKLAPGVNYVDSEQNKGIQSGASTRSAVNVFIDGVSLKNQILDGGIAGQQDSRGNPFGQLAVQEFRVLTQNYKAEYEQAAAAVITAVTKSGTNEFHGELFGQYTGKALSSDSYFVRRGDFPEPKFKRKQYGVSLGGPIIQDKLFFFGAYEGNDQDRAQSVRLGNRSPENLARFGEFEGAFVSPFRGDFFFGKLTFIPDSSNTFDLSYSRRTEDDIQGFGGQTAFSAAENKHNVVDTVNGKWTMRGENFVNEFDVNYLRYLYNPTSLNPDSPTFDYQGVIVIGGKDGSQAHTQRGILFRDDLTWTGFDGHTIKGGIKFAKQTYDFNKLFFVQPRYTFRIDNRGTPQTTDDLDFSFPFEARLGTGDPRIKAKNSQFGIYIQDDWQVTDKLEVNLGLRWDYESNMFNNKYVTPANAAAALRSLPTTDYFDPDDYITDGNDRDPYLGMFQPRLGLSYDLNGDRSTVLFAGYGRYFDRNVFNNTLDEQFRLQNKIGAFFFSRDGLQRDGNPTVVWNNAYLTREGLLALQATDVTGRPELFAVPNNAKPPRTDQFSAGVRQRFGQWQGSVTATYIRGRNGYTHLFATRRADNGECCDTSSVNALGFSNVLIGYDGLDTRYKGLYFTMDKPYSRASGWGVNIAYTLAKGEQNGNDLFSLDKKTPDDWGFRPRPGDERHKLVIGAMLDLPYGFRVSTLSQFGSGAAYQVTDHRNGGGINEREFIAAYPVKTCIDGVFAFCEVNLTVENNFNIYRGATVNVAVDLLNAFNNNNFAGFDGFVGLNNPLEPGRIGNSSLTLPRRIQFRAGLRF